ncbi:hypothetical protein BS78_05G083700 [Paspalum vaginatum]|nr:hypothetical protein BS78_05G083700 [Paspalum vaginatum]
MDTQLVQAAASASALQRWSDRAGIGSGVAALSAAVESARRLLAVPARRGELRNGSLEAFLREVGGEVFRADTLLDELDYHRIREEREADAGEQFAGKLMDQMEHGEYASTRNSGPLQDNCSTVDLSISDSSNHQLVLFSPAPNSLVPWMELDMNDILYRIDRHVNELNEMQHDALKALKLEELDVLALGSWPPDMDFRETTPLVTEPKVYGREKEQCEIINKLMTSEADDGHLSVFAIVGNGGIGKTTLARLVYNDAIIGGHFLPRIWIYVSVNFDEVKLTHDLLECLYGDRFEGTEDLKILQKHVQDGIQSRRLLLVMDDIWEDNDTSRWDTFLAPLRHAQVKGNKILVTTRKLSVVKMIGAKDEIKLNGLVEGSFWSLFKDYAFGSMRPQPKLIHIGHQIAKKLKGYPLAAKTVGTLLRRKLDVEHWRRVLDSNEWIYQGSNEDIMPALRISYNHLPLTLQPCFSYCALFPKNYHFSTEQLVNTWIAQGFVCPKGTERIEDVGCEYFNELKDSGFIQYEPTRLAYIMHDLIHDLAQMVSSDECFSIEALGSRTTPKFVRHVSVITESAYRPKGDGSMAPNESFKQEFVEAIGSLQPKNVGTVMLIGRYDSNFSEAFRDKSDEFRAIRVLKLEMMFDGLGSLVCDLAAFIHLRYLELRAAYATSNLQLSESLSKLYHLEVLDINIRHNWGSRTELPRGLSNLVNLRHFLAFENLHTKIAAVGKLKFLQELKAFKVRKKKEFSIAQLSTLMELRGSLKIYGLENVDTKEEAMLARLKDKVLLSNLHLSWKKKQDDTASHTIVLEELQPHTTLKCLRIDGHRGSAPKWLTTDFSLTSLRSLHLEGCQNWVALPPIEKLQFLRELHLVRLFKIREVIIGPLEVLELREMGRLTKCTVLDEEYSSKIIRVLEIISCYRLNRLPFLQSSRDDENKQRLPNLYQIHILDWLESEDLPALPVTRTSTDLDISNAGSVRSMSFRLKHAVGSEGLALVIRGGPHLIHLDEKLLAFHNLTNLEEMEIIGSPNLSYFAWNSLPQLTFLKRLTLSNCPKVFSSFLAGYTLPPSLEDLDLSMCDITGSQLSEVLVSLTNLSSLSVSHCDKITSLAVGLLSNEMDLIPGGLCHMPLHCLMRMQKLHISSDMHFVSTKGLGEFASLEELVIKGCAELLSTMLLQAEMESSKNIILPSSLLHLMTDCLPDQLLQHSSLTSLIQLDLEQSPSLTSVNLHSCTALQKLLIKNCALLASCEGFQSLIRLSTIIVMDCPSLVSLALQSCSALRHLHIEGCHTLYTLESLVWLPLLSGLNLIENRNLVSLKLHSHAALESLNIQGCPRLSSWEHLKSFAHLVNLEIRNAPGFVSAWNHMALTSQELRLPLQTLHIDGLSFLTAAICRNIVSLKKLRIHALDFDDVDCQMSRFTDEQEEALQLLNSLQRLELSSMMHLRMLPSELHCLSSLQHLIIKNCESIMSLPEKGLPVSLKLLDVDKCSTELYEQCQHVRGLQWLYIRGRKQEKG